MQIEAPARLLGWDDVGFQSGWRAVAFSAVSVALLTLLCWWTVSYAQSPLRRYPGPFLAGACLPNGGSHGRRPF